MTTWMAKPYMQGHSELLNGFGAGVGSIPMAFVEVKYEFFGFGLEPAARRPPRKRVAAAGDSLPSLFNKGGCKYMIEFFSDVYSL